MLLRVYKLNLFTIDFNDIVREIGTLDIHLGGSVHSHITCNFAKHNAPIFHMYIWYLYTRTP